MSTELTIYDRINDPMAAVKQLGHAIAASKMFGAETPAQGEVFALECLVRGTPPLMLAEKYHVIFGKLSMKAEAMLAEFERRGGTYRVLSRTAEKAAIELTRRGKDPETFSLTWEEAKKEPFVYEPKKGVKESDIIDLLEKGTPPEIKTKYRTPRSRSQMLWARVVSDGVNAVDPGVKCGAYTPEEVSDFPEFAGRMQADNNGHTDDAEIVDAEIVDAPDAGKPATEEAPFDAPDKQATQSDSANGGTSGMCTAGQSATVKELFGQLNVSPEKRTEILAKRGAATVRNLTYDQADELIKALDKKLDARLKSQAAATTAEPAAGGKTAASDAELAGQVRELLKQVNQVHPGTVAAFKAKLATSGIAKIDELRREDLLSLLSALKAPDKLEAYFGVAIWEASPKN